MQKILLRLQDVSSLQVFTLLMLLMRCKEQLLIFDNIQKSEQGGLRLIDILLFPAGTIVASGPSCSEQGSGRWLPKPSDTLNKFILMSKPSVGYKNIPLLWIEMIDVSSIVGFIYLIG